MRACILAILALTMGACSGEPVVHMTDDEVGAAVAKCRRLDLVAAYIYASDYRGVASVFCAPERRR